MATHHDPELTISSQNRSPYASTDFDRRQEGCLGVLAHCGAELYVPFYANTFPLGYHYSQSLATADGPQQGRVIRHIWADAIPEGIFQNTERISILFGAEATLKAITKRVSEANLSQTSGRIKVEPTFFTRYQPKCFFHRNDRCSAKVLDNDAAVRKAFELVEVFTDVPEQARIVVDYLQKKVETRLKPRIIGDIPDSHTLIASESRTLNLYFYGAPLTAALQESREYVKVDLPSWLWEEDQFLTHCIVISPEEMDTSSLLSCLTHYHQDLFATAAKNSKDLRNVWWAYNRTADMMRNPPRFRTEHKYARCLVEHHAPKQENEVRSSFARREPAEIQGSSKLHVHFGLGSLGMGFILGALRCEKIIVIQRGTGQTADLLLKQQLHNRVLIETSAGDYSHPFKVLRHAKDLQAKSLDDSILVLDYNAAEELKELKATLTTAESISVSCREGQEKVLQLLISSNVPSTTPVYWIENSIPAAVRSEGRLEIMKCIADRICTPDERLNDRDKGELHVDCEEYSGELLIPSAEEPLRRVFGENVNRSVFAIPVGEAYETFFRSRKLYLVNMLHSLVAVLSYKQLLDWNVPSALWIKMPAPAFVRALWSDWDTRCTIESFRCGQILCLIAETDAAILGEALKTTDVEDQFYLLRGYSDCVVDRMKSTIDYFGRLLDVTRVSGARRPEEKGPTKEEMRRKVHEFDKALERVNQRKEQILALPIREALNFWEIVLNLNGILEDCDFVIDRL